MDLVQSAGEMNHEGVSVPSGDCPGPEPGWQTPLKEICRTGVQPVLVETEVSRNTIPRHPQHGGQRLGGMKLAVLGDGNDVNVLG